MKPIRIGSDNVHKVDKVKNQLTGLYVSNATIVMTLYDSDDNAVTGAVGLTHSYVADSDGQYLGTIPAAATATLTAGSVYKLVTTTTVSGITRVDHVRYRAKYAQGN